jgi:hypothetical protein
MAARQSPPSLRRHSSCACRDTDRTPPQAPEQMTASHRWCTPSSRRMRCSRVSKSAQAGGGAGVVDRHAAQPAQHRHGAPRCGSASLLTTAVLMPRPRMRCRLSTASGATTYESPLRQGQGREGCGAGGMQPEQRSPARHALVPSPLTWHSTRRQPVEVGQGHMGVDGMPSGWHKMEEAKGVHKIPPPTTHPRPPCSISRPTSNISSLQHPVDACTMCRQKGRPSPT